MKSLSASFILLASTLLACTRPAQPMSKYTIEFQATDDQGHALKDLKISIGNTEIGSTGATGFLRAQLHAHKGDRFAVQFDCPKSMKNKEELESIVFHDTRRLDTKQRSIIQKRLVCSRTKRKAVIVVDTGGHPDIPVLVDGIEKARTGLDGIAHIQVQKEPGHAFIVSLETKLFPQLVPSNPKRPFTLKSIDDIFIFEQPFSKIKKRSKRKERKHPKIAKRTSLKNSRPVRIE